MSDRRFRTLAIVLGVFFTLLFVYFIADQCFERRPILEKYEISVPARGQMLHGELVPWVILSDTGGRIVVLQKGDSLEFVFSYRDSVYIGDTTYSSNVNGIDWNKLEVKSILEVKKQMDRSAYFIGGLKCRPGSLIFHLDTNYVLDKEFFEKRRIPCLKPQQVSEVKGLKIERTTPYLYLGVNDVYLHNDEIKVLDSIDKKLLDKLLKSSVPKIQIDSTKGQIHRFLQEELAAYAARNHDWFYEDNDSSFTVTVKVFRKPRPTPVFGWF